MIAKISYKKHEKLLKQNNLNKIYINEFLVSKFNQIYSHQ